VIPHLSFHVVGISHHLASLEERERFAFSSSEMAALLQAQHEAGRSSVLLSTCNRCELYWQGEADFEPWFRSLARERGTATDPELIRHDNEDAVRHLFSVSAGLDSQILGETEILGQVRRAYDAARAAGSTTRSIDLIFSAALASGRRVRSETLLGRHPASVSSAAVDLVAQEWGQIAGHHIVVLGAGEAAEGVLRALHQHRASSVRLLNRRPLRSKVLAEAWGAMTGAWEELDQQIAAADLLVVATGGGRPVVSAAQLGRSARTERELYVLDLSVPRNVEPTARQLPGIRLLDLDDLQRLCCPAAAGASTALYDAERIIDDELVRLGLSLRGKTVAPRLAELHRIGIELAEQEAAWALARLDSITDPEREIVRQMADRLVRRVLYPVSRNLRENGPGSEGRESEG
jgi:glutamyl-tRNA reductase